MSKEHESEKEKARHCLLKIISALTYLARQGLAMRKGNAEFDSNFYQLLKAWAEDDPILTKWLEKKRENFTSHEIQKEMLMLMAGFFI